MNPLIALVLLFSLFSCQCDPICQGYRLEEEVWFSDNGKVKVLATTAMIGDLVKQVGGEHVDTILLIRGELDPHSYQLVKGDDEKLAFADVIFFNGLGLEHGPSLQMYLSDADSSIALGDAVRRADPRLILSHNGQIDPHIWMDISLWGKTVPYIVKQLSAFDPVHADDYRRRGHELAEHLQESHRELKRIIQAIPDRKRYLVTSHDAFNYFARAYLATDQELRKNSWSARFQAPEGLAPESQLSTKDIQSIIDHMQFYDIHVLFPESNVSRDSIAKIVQAGRENGLELRIATAYLYGDAMGEPGSEGDTYLKMLRHNGSVIAKYLKEN